MMQRGVDLMSGKSGIMSTAHTDIDLEQTVDAFRETLRDMLTNHVL
jgi:glutamate-1-semialdehyde aminotransferase